MKVVQVTLVLIQKFGPVEALTFSAQLVDKGYEFGYQVRCGGEEIGRAHV